MSRGAGLEEYEPSISKAGVEGAVVVTYSLVVVVIVVVVTVVVSELIFSIFI